MELEQLALPIIITAGIILLILIVAELWRWIYRLVIDSRNFGYNAGFDAGYDAHRKGIELEQIKVIDGKVAILPKSNKEDT